MTIRLRTLGDLGVLIDGREVPEMCARPVRLALIVYLALERQVSRDKIMALIGLIMMVLGSLFANLVITNGGSMRMVCVSVTTPTPLPAMTVMVCTPVLSQINAIVSVSPPVCVTAVCPAARQAKVMGSVAVIGLTVAVKA